MGKNTFSISTGLNKKIQIILEPSMFELHGSTYTWIIFFFQINTQFTLYPWVSHPWIQPTAVNWGSKFLSSVHWILWGKTWGYRGPALGVDDCEHWDFITSTGDPVAGLAISYSSLLSPNSSNYALKKKKKWSSNGHILWILNQDM